MTRTVTFLALLLASLVCPQLARAQDDATLFRLFLTNGTAVVSYGEYTRVEDRVIFSMPLGRIEDPRLQVVTLPAKVIDWPRTERYAASVRYLHYAATRAEDDCQQLSADVARALNQIAASTDRARALELAEQARKMLAGWPRTHFSYRQQEVLEIVSLLDESISTLRAAMGLATFDLSLEAVPVVEIEPVLALPTPAEQVAQLTRLVSLLDSATERTSLLQAALVLTDGTPGMDAKVARSLRENVVTLIRRDQAVDAKYARIWRKLYASAARAASRANIPQLERVLEQISTEDARLGRQRPEIMHALHASVQARLEAVRHFHLLQDQWVVRRTLHRQYHRMVGPTLLQLIKTQPSLEAIERLEGPSPKALIALQKRLTGGADWLQRLSIPPTLRPAHDLLVGAWRFAETAVRIRYEAVSSGEVTTAWEASSAAAGSLLMLSRAQQDMRDLLEPPRLQ